MIHKVQTSNRGVSPVIGIILMVAVTVILVALASNVVFDLSNDVGDNLNMAFSINENADEVEVQVIENGNVDTIRATEDGTGDISLGDLGTGVDGPSAGDTYTISTSSSYEGTVTIVGSSGSGEQVLRTFDVDIGA